MTCIPDIKLIRTDTTLDLSQKAEKNDRLHSELAGAPQTPLKPRLVVAKAKPPQGSPGLVSRRKARSEQMHLDNDTVI